MSSPEELAKRLEEVKRIAAAITKAQTPVAPVPPPQQSSLPPSLYVNQQLPPPPQQPPQQYAPPVSHTSSLGRHVRS